VLNLNIIDQKYHFQSKKAIQQQHTGYGWFYPNSLFRLFLPQNKSQTTLKFKTPQAI
jgi:hypothetical protein